MPPSWLHKFELKPGCWVFVPDKQAVIIGREIKRELESRWSAPDYYAHLQPGGHVAALKKHLDSTLFIRADIHQFFNHINRSRVTRNLRDVLGSYKRSRQIANASLVRIPSSDPPAFVLPFGFIQSAVIASICLHKSRLGKYLDAIAKDGFIVTVYMDDIIISTREPAESAAKVLESVKEKAEKSNFPLSASKTIGPSTNIEAFNINLSHRQLKIMKERLSEFQDDISSSTTASTTQGIIGYVRTVCPEQADYLESISNHI